jgi:hypothetical protein
MLLDILIQIASIDENVWYKLMFIYDEFREYAYKRGGIIKYRKLFTIVEIKNGSKCIYIFGKLNSIEDKPAIYEFGNKIWLKNGRYHRNYDLPAVSFATGLNYWYINGNLHRDNDLPMEVRCNGDKYWFINNNIHRNDDKPAIIESNGSRYWYMDSKNHRENYKHAFITTTQRMLFIDGYHCGKDYIFRLLMFKFMQFLKQMYNWVLKLFYK